MTSRVPLSHLKAVAQQQVTDPDVLILNNVTPWQGIGGDCFFCAMCCQSCEVSYETNWQWGAPCLRTTYVADLCSKCLSDACKASSNAATSKYVLK